MNRALAQSRSTTAPRRGNQRGATMVEFAIIAPLLFLLLFGVIELARLVSAYTTVWTGAREGARYATTAGESSVTPGIPRNRDCAGIIEAARAKAVTTVIDVSDVSIRWIDQDGTVVADCDGIVADPVSASIPNGSLIEVEVTGEFDSAVPLLDNFLDGLALDSSQSRSMFQGIVGA